MVANYSTKASYYVLTDIKNLDRLQSFNFISLCKTTALKYEQERIQENSTAIISRLCALR